MRWNPYCNMDKPWRHYAKWNKQSQRNKYCMVPLTWGSYHSNCGIGEDSWESLGLQGDQTSPS